MNNTDMVSTGAYIIRPLCARRAPHLAVIADVVNKQLVPKSPPFYCQYCEREVTDDGSLVSE